MLLLVLPSAVTAQVVANGGFELPVVTGFQYNPTGGSWTFAGTSGVSRNGSTFTSQNNNAPAGAQVGFVQTTGALTQTIGGFTHGGMYQITFYAAGMVGPNQQTITLSMTDGAATYGLGSFTMPLNNPAYATYTTSLFTMLGTSGTLSVTGKSSAAATALLDQVSIRPVQPAGALTSAAGSPFTVGSGPFSVVVGDFNGDGIPDIATANTNSGNVSVLLGKVTGGFTAATGSPFTVGTLPYSVAVGDFNGDGIPDLATANVGGSNVTVLLGNGTGGFTEASGSPIRVGFNPYSVAVGDFDGDGRLDIATANQGSRDVTVLLGNGMGGFSPTGPFSVGFNPYSVAVGDFNGDGRLDIATANYGTNHNVTVLLGKVTGGFMAATSIPLPAGSKPSSVAVGDFNGDGRLDIATANYGNDTVTVLLGNGTGGFTAATGSPFPVGTNPYSVAVGDFNGDGTLDIATANYGSNNLTVLLGNATGGFTAATGSPFPVGSQPSSVAVGDLNGDGRVDIVTANSFSNNGVTSNVTVLLGGLAATGASLSTTAASNIAYGTAVPLMLSVTPAVDPFSAVPSGTATFFDGATSLGTAAQTVSPYTLTPATPLSAGSHTLTATYGGDTRNSSSTSGSVVITVAQATQIITFTTSPPVSAALNSSFTVAATGGASGNAVVFTSAGGCFHSGATYTMASPSFACTVIADQPGNTNYAAATHVTQSVNATQATQTIAFTTNPPASAAYNGSFTVTATGGASFNAVIFTSSGGCSHSGATYTMTSGTTACTVIANQAGNTNYAAAAQVTRTVNASLAAQTIAFGAQSGLSVVGNAVLAPASATSGLAVTVISITPVTCAAAGSAVVMRSAGTCTLQATQAGNVNYVAATPVSRSFAVVAAGAAGTLTGATGSPFPVGTTPRSVAVGDFNGDGIPDIAAANYAGSDVTVLLGKLTGGFTAATFPVGTNPRSAAVGDFNGDGRLDIATANQGGNNVTVLLGNGTGGFMAAAGSPFPVGFSPYSVAVGDFDGDGRLDIATANLGGDNVTVLLGNVAGGFTAATGSPFSVGTAPYSVAVGDFNGDGRLDIATANGVSNDVTVLLGTVTGGFTAATFTVGTAPQSVAVGDFNGDGRLDIATANQGSKDVTVLLGNVTGGFTAATFPVGTAPYSVALGDFNGDGRLDIATANGSNAVTVLLGNVTGGFTAATGSPFPVGTGPRSVAVGDFNGDGRLDIATANVSSNNITVLLGGLAATSASISTTAASNIAYGTAVPLTLSVTPAVDPFSAVPAGAATFFDGATSLGTAAQTVSPYTFTPATPLSAGLHTLTATYGGDTRNSSSTSGSVVVTVTKAAQTVTFTTSPPVSAGLGSSFTVAATGGASGNAVIFTSSGGCSNSGATYTMTSPTAACTVIANQPGNTNYSAATQVTRTVTATLASQTITFTANPPASAAFNSSFTVAATGGASGNAVIFTSSGGCSNSGATYSMRSGTTACTVIANQLGNTNYAAAAQVTRSVNATLVSQTITFTTSPPASAGPGSSFTVAAAATSGIAVIFTSSGGCSNSGATYTMTSPTTACTVIANQPGNTNYAAAAQVTRTVNALATQTIAFGAQSGLSVVGNAVLAPASATSGLAVTVISITPVTCSVAGSAAVMLSPGTCTLQATQAGDAIYAAATPVSRSFAVIAAGAAGALTAATGSPFPVGRLPYSVAVGDFNGDAIPDIATANYSSNNVTVLLGNGTGGFTAAVGSPFPVGSGPYAVAVGDFTGNGRLDIATANAGGNNVTVLLGNGTGGFTAATGSPFTVGNSPRSVAVGDFNGDGRLDIATANYGGNNVTVLLGNVTGGFTAATFTVGTAPQSVAVGDFNGDGRLDIATANFGSNNVTVLLGNVTGGFTAATFTVGTAPRSVAVGDFDGDGRLDIATANANSQNVTVLLGQVTGGFAAATGSPFPVGGTSPVSVAVGDFNGDGRLDIATANAGSNNLTVLLGNVTGGFTAAAGSPFPVGNAPFSMAVEDFNGDGRLDIVTANNGSNNATVLLGGLAATNATLSTTAASNIVYGTAVPLTLTVTPAVDPFSAVPTGAATFFDGATLLGTAAQTVSPYTFTPATPLALGPHTLTATYGGDTRNSSSTSGSVVITVTIVQTIAFAGTVPQNAVFGSGPVTLAATSNAPSPLFTFGTTSAASICTVSGTSVTLAGVGQCVLTVTAAATGNYAAVTTPVTRTLTITAASQTITFAGTVPQSAAIGSGPVTLAATSNAPSPLFTFGTTSAASICTVSGTSVTLVAVGPCVLTVTAAATGSYAAVTTAVTQTLTITAVTQTIAFSGTVPQNAVFGSGPVTLAATSNAPSPIFTFGTTSAASICTVSGTSVTLAGVGQCVLTVTAAATGNFAAVTTAVTQTLTIGQANPTVNFTTAPPASAAFGSTFAVAATTNAGSTVTISVGAGGGCAIAGVTVTMTSGTTACVVTATSPPNGNYAQGTTSLTTAASRIAPAVSFTGAPGSAAYQFTFTVASTTTASSTAVITSTGSCTNTGNAVKMTSGTGSCTLTATWAADSNYTAATAGQSTAASKIPPVVTFTGAPVTAASGSTFTVASTTTASSAASIVAGGACSISGNTVTMTSGTGTCSLTASWAADGNYSPATATQTVTAFSNTLYSLTTSSSPLAGGSITATVGGLPVGSNIPAGSLVTVTAVPNAGYVFANFSGSTGGVTNPQSFTIGAAANVVANFTALTPQLAVSPGIASVSGSSVTVPLKVTNSGFGPATNVTITAVTIVSFTGTGPVSAVSNSGNIGTIGIASAGSASVVFSWPNGAALNNVKYKVSLSADGGYTTTSSTITTLY